jgi:outer membrane protein OmpA-like peptidoglycan-associated protein
MKTVRTLLFLAVVLALGAPVLALEVSLSAVQFPEQRKIEVPFALTSHAPKAEVTARVEARAAQTEVEVSFKKMRAAVLFAGDITSYVLWAVTRDGKYENLGELYVRDESGSATFSTGLKEFAMVVTAEPYAMVDEPSDLLVFFSQAPGDPKGTRVTPFQFAGFVPAAKYGVESIANINYTGETPLDLMQAQKAYELAQRANAAKYAAEAMSEAKLTLAQATSLAAASGRRKEMVDYSRRTVALSSEALRTTKRRIEEQQIEARIAQRKAEMEALEARARSAETTASTAQASLQQTTAAKAELEAQMTALRQEKAGLESSKAALEAEKADLEKQKNALLARLQGALSKVAETKNTARGFIVNLPDILFDTNQATLKPEAKLTIAKLSGIMLLMSELNIRIEGHTDSTGSAAYNQKLSQNRAEAVLAFLQENGLASERMTAIGYGMDRPVADNATAEGRSKNRRVELVIAEGQIGAPQ